MGNCEHYVSGELTNQNYCNTKNCIYKIKPKKRILPDCNKRGNVNGPVLENLVSEEVQ